MIDGVGVLQSGIEGGQHPVKVGVAHDSWWTRPWTAETKVNFFQWPTRPNHSTSHAIKHLLGYLWLPTE
jgi:hypothetical protein